jgi:hypothetical protein
MAKSLLLKMERCFDFAQVLPERLACCGAPRQTATIKVLETPAR